jgi:hypothetical protein
LQRLPQAPGALALAVERGAQQQHRAWALHRLSHRAYICMAYDLWAMDSIHIRSPSTHGPRHDSIGIGRRSGHRLCGVWAVDTRPNGQ